MFGSATGIVLLLVTMLSALASSRVDEPSLLDKRQESFTVTSPSAPDTIPIGEGSHRQEPVNIFWTVPESIRQNELLVRLMQGDNLTSLSVVYEIATGYPNNGSYLWQVYEPDTPTSANDDALLYRGHDYAGNNVSSGCSFSIELKTGFGDVAYSDYIALLRTSDGGLNATAECPRGKPAQGRAYTDPSMADPTATPTAVSAQSDPSNSSSSGISSGALAAAIVVPILALLIGLGLVLFFGKRRGWFIRKPGVNGNLDAPIDTTTVGDAVVAEKALPGVPTGDGLQYPMSELPEEGVMRYQLEGDKARRL